MNTIINAMLFCIGWVSGGGIATFIVMGIFESMFGTDYNTMFVAGCLWGTFGVIAGRFMVRHAAVSALNGEKA